MNTVAVVAFAAVLVGLASAFPQTAPATLLSRTEVRDEAGQFALSFQTSDGTTVNEQGALKRNNDGTDNVLVKQGSFFYYAPDGTPITLTYVADELGFRAEGAHLPVAPTVPAITF